MLPEPKPPIKIHFFLSEQKNYHQYFYFPDDALTFLKIWILGGYFNFCLIKRGMYMLGLESEIYSEIRFLSV